MTTGIGCSDSPGTVTTTVPSDAEPASSMEGGFRSDYRTVHDIRPHDVAGSTGKPLIPLPDRPQTWWELREVVPALAAGGRRGIAVDLPGMGGSGKPDNGYDKKSLAAVIHGFVGAFSSAADHPEVAREVAVSDGFHANESSR